MTFNDMELIDGDCVEQLPILDLHYNAEKCCKAFLDTKKKEDDKRKQIKEVLIYVADFETDPWRKQRALMCCLSNVATKEEYTFTGEDCAVALLTAVEDHAIIYFHNSSYDINFLMEWVDSAEVIRKGMKTISATLRFCGKTITVRDFKTLINMRLAKLPAYFHLDQEIKKEKGSD